MTQTAPLLAPDMPPVHSPALPTELTIEVTTVCNVRPPCVMCGKNVYHHQGWLDRDADHFPKRLLPQLTSVLSQLQVLSLWGVGEPLACPYLFEFLAAVPATCHTQLTSNGGLLDPYCVDEILRRRVTSVDFSIDAASPQTYRRIRHGDFDATIANIAALIAERTRRGAEHPNVILNMCLMRENVDELPAFVRLAKRINASHCYAFHLNQGLSWRAGWFDYQDQHCALEPERHDHSVAEAFSVSREIGMPFEIKGRAFFHRGREAPAGIAPHLPTPLAAPPRTHPPGLGCALPWQHAIVHRKGNVSNCCWQSGYLGSIAERSFEQIWNGRLQQAIRRELLAARFHRACQGSSLCPPRGRP